MSRYKDQPKNPGRRVQMAPEHESAFGIQEPIRHFWSAEQHSKRAEFPLVGLWPNGHRVTIMHTLFDLFAKRCVQIQTLIFRTYFLKSFGLYKQRLNLIIQHLFFGCFERHTFMTLKPHIFYDHLSECCCKIRVFRFQRELNKFL